MLDSVTTSCFSVHSERLFYVYNLHSNYLISLKFIIVVFTCLLSIYLIVFLACFFFLFTCCPCQRPLSVGNRIVVRPILSLNVKCFKCQITILGYTCKVAQRSCTNKCRIHPRKDRCIIALICSAVSQRRTLN